MKKNVFKGLILFAFSLFSLIFIGCSNVVQGWVTPSPTVVQTAKTGAVELKTKVLFVNTSRNSNGNTYKMGETFLKDIPHDIIFLNDYKIYQLGQQFPDDQFGVVLDAMTRADTIVIGTPVYWHTMSGSLKTFIDRLYEADRNSVVGLKNKKLYFLMQGISPTEETIKNVPFIMTRIATRYEMQYMGAATSMDDMQDLRKILQNNL